MPIVFAVLIAVIVLGLLIARFVVPALPLRRSAPPSGVADLVLAGIGVLGLIGHCGAMFYTAAARSVPGTQSVVEAINRLGTLSIVLFAIPSLLVIVGLRRVPAPALGLVVLALAAVGLTMYDGGPTRVHLVAITVCVAVLALTAATLVRGPRVRPAAGHA